MVFRSVFSGAGESVEVGTLGEWIPREKTGLFLGTQHAGYPWGTFLGGIAASAVLATFGNENWRYVFFIFPAVGVIVWIFWWRYSNGKNYAKFQEACKTSGFTTPLDVDSSGEIQEHRKGSLGRCVRNPNIMSMAVLAFLFCSTYYGFAFMQTPLLSFSLGYSYASSAFLSTILTITGGIFTIVWGSVSDRVGTKKIMMICALWLCVCFLLYTQASAGLWVIVVLQLLFGVCANAVYGVIYTIVGVSCEKGDAVTSTGFALFGMYIGAGCGAVLVGRLVELGGGWESVSGYNSALITFAVLLAVAFVVVLLFTRETSGKKRGKDFSLVSLKSCNIEE
jgi:MFS family permease